MTLFHKVNLSIAGLLLFSSLAGQLHPYKPLSYPVYSPVVLNPAITGSRDFTNINLIVRATGSPGAQMLTYNSRLHGKGGSSVIIGSDPFSSFGLGGYIYQDEMDLSRNLGFGVSGAYHVGLGEHKLSGLSFGLALKGIYNMVTSEGEAAGETDNVMTPNLDFGIYYYGPSLFLGISSSNLLGMITDTLHVYGDEAYVPRTYNFYGGYKFVLSREKAIVLEPSLLVSLNDSTFSEAGKHIHPYLKLYMQNFYIGTYYKDVDHLSLFLQYQFPRFYTGLFVEFPRTGFLTKDNIILEVNLGLNIGRDKEFYNTRHW